MFIKRLLIIGKIKIIQGYKINTWNINMTWWINCLIRNNKHSNTFLFALRLGRLIWKGWWMRTERGLLVLWMLCYVIHTVEKTAYWNVIVIKTWQWLSDSIIVSVHEGFCETVYLLFIYCLILNNIIKF